ncbi:tripartite motif-containing protein 60-like [Chionomys nivalis]|uniref:tripartite motif-containing protein 60-like n=1 Tax=Chionomys nivalis TaxID=269649 RepID=UPI002595B909|nr:tripartite motif-containing protein 60-like [Chionomys nivalis]
MSSPTTSVQPCTGSGELEAGQADLPAETHCPICKENFKNPVTIECRHKFCLSCISAFWKDLKDNFSCPVCHVNCPERNFQSNQQLSKLTEVAKWLPVRKGRRQRQIGERSREAQPLALSCGQDQEVCSPSPTCHFVWPMEDATLCHRKQTEYYIKLWRDKVESVEKVLVTQRKRSLELKKRADRRREEVTSEYQQYWLFLREQRESILEELENEELTGLSKMQANIEEFSDHIASLKLLLEEVRNNCVKSELDLLASVKDSYKRHKALKRPAIFSLQLTEYGYQLPPQYSGLDRIVKRFHVDVLLDPETANYKLKISKDKKIALFVITQRVPRSRRRFSGYPVVLGSEGYSSGRQYWEVDVENKHQWLLGICQEPFPRRRGRSFRNQQFSVHDKLRGVGLLDGKTYLALGRKIIYLLPKVNPNRIGIFLDSEIHEVSFYNLHDKSLLYRFRDCPSGALWPYFYTGEDGRPLKICTPKDLEC